MFSPRNLKEEILDALAPVSIISVFTVGLSHCSGQVQLIGPQHKCTICLKYTFLCSSTTLVQMIYPTTDTEQLFEKYLAT